VCSKVRPRSPGVIMVIRVFRVIRIIRVIRVFAQGSLEPVLLNL
jgi:hypothetical protein